MQKVIITAAVNGYRLDNAVVFFASAKSSFVTGDFLSVTGGVYQLW